MNVRIGQGLASRPAEDRPASEKNQAKMLESSLSAWNDFALAAWFDLAAGLIDLGIIFA
jgi:hypothetical protein